MKRIILVGDGMGDYPHAELGDRTVLQAARIPNLRRIAAAGRIRQVRTVPSGMSPGSDVANLSLLGYDPAANYTGRAPIEAAGAGIRLSPRDIAVRCNLVTVEDGRMIDYSAGHISTAEGRALIEAMASELSGAGPAFHAGVSYRHLAVWPDGSENWVSAPPHDIAGQTVASHLPNGEGAEPVRAWIEASARVFADHPVNLRRRAEGKAAATHIWLWGQGRALTLKTFPEQYGLRGGVVTAVDLVRGLGVLAGLDAPRIPGATGFLDTDYAAKVKTAHGMLDTADFVYVHIEAPDECGHMGDVQKKIQACEEFDARVVGPLWEYLENRGEPYRLIATTDHRTPCALRGHTGEPVPLAILEGPVGARTAEAPFDEAAGAGAEAAFAFDVVGEALR